MTQPTVGATGRVVVSGLFHWETTAELDLVERRVAWLLERRRALITGINGLFVTP